MLEGTMLVIDREETTFHNPSIEDYLRHHMNLGRTDLRALVRSLADASPIIRFLTIATGYDASGIRQLLRRCPDAVATMFWAANETLDYSLAGEDRSVSEYLTWVLEIGQVLEFPALALYVENQVNFLAPNKYDISNLVRLAVDMSEDSVVSHARSAAFADQLAQWLMRDIEKAVENDCWAWARESFYLYSELPDRGISPRLTAWLIKCGLSELRRLAVENKFEEHQIRYIDDLLSFLDGNYARSESPEEFEIVERALNGLVEARNHRRTHRLANTASWRVPADTTDDETAWRKAKLIMSNLILQEADRM